MGAVLHCETFDGKLTPAELRKAYADRRENMLIEHGADPYNGTWSTLDGSLVFVGDVLNSREDAEGFIDGRADKWGAAFAVRFHDNRTETTKKPTFNSEPADSHKNMFLLFWRPGVTDGDYRTRAVVTQRDVLRPGDPAARVIVAADQLSAAGKTQLAAACRACVAADKDFNAVNRTVQALVAALSDPRKEVTTAEFAEFKKQRKQAAKLAKIRDKMAVRLYELDTRFASKLYSTETVNHGQSWLVGGLCGC
jgi:hypothetical protein